MSKRMMRMAALVFVVVLMVGAVPAFGTAGDNSKSGAAIGDTYTFTLAPGEQWYAFLDLSDYYPTDMDVFTVTCTVDQVLEIHIVDCCVMQDLICWYNPDGIHRKCGMSPIEVWKDMPCKANRPKTFHVGYAQPSAGGFPAGYEIWVTAP